MVHLSFQPTPPPELTSIAEMPIDAPPLLTAKADVAGMLLFICSLSLMLSAVRSTLPEENVGAVVSVCAHAVWVPISNRPAANSIPKTADRIVIRARWGPRTGVRPPCRLPRHAGGAGNAAAHAGSRGRAPAPGEDRLISRPFPHPDCRAAVSGRPLASAAGAALGPVPTGPTLRESTKRPARIMPLMPHSVPRSYSPSRRRRPPVARSRRRVSSR